MKITVVNDIHIGSKYCDDKDARKKLDALVNDGTVILNGDIVDMSCCPKGEVKKLREYQRDLMKKWGQFYVRGNHDLLPDWHPFTVVGKTMFTHAHLFGDKKRVDKWTAYEKKSPGASRLKLMWVDFADDLDWIKGQRPMHADTVKYVAMFAKQMGCTEVILGHMHPLKELSEIHDGVTVRCLPKGFNHIEIIGTDDL